MKKIKELAAVLLSIMMVLSMMPAMAFADEEAVSEPITAETAVEIATEEAADEEAASETIAVEATDTSEEAAVDEVSEEADIAVEEVPDDAEMGISEESFSEGIEAEGIDGTDPEEQMEEFFFSEDTGSDGYAPSRPMSVKGDRLTGNDLKYYNRYKTIINGVTNGSRKNSYITVKVGTFLGKRTFTAKQLGVKRIGYYKNGTWQMYSSVQKKIAALLNPISWKRVYTSVLSDMSNDSYWVDWYAQESFYEWHYKCNFNGSKLIFTKDSYIEFRLPVMPEFAQDASSTKVYIYKADKDKLAAVNQARENARYIVQSFDDELSTTFAGATDEEIDLNRLWRYCQWIVRLTEYDHEAAANENIARTTPWSLVSVLDGDDDTLAVCAGYARAFKYLCDLSTFRSDWIDCQIVSGSATDSGVGHMWNLVRMNDGQNYVIDPTWMDDGDTDDDKWFLRGDPSGTSNSYTIETSYRVYDDWVKAAFAPAERKLSTNSTYMTGWEKTIALTKPVIKNPVKGKKKITVKWKAVTAALGSLYVDGYQIRYSTKKSMKGAKTVTVKGYKKASRVIKKLKSKKYYYVQVRSYAKMGSNTYYSDWSAKKKVKTK